MGGRKKGGREGGWGEGVGSGREGKHALRTERYEQGGRKLNSTDWEKEPRRFWS